jgi:hypothetical protein
MKVKHYVKLLTASPLGKCFNSLAAEDNILKKMKMQLVVCSYIHSVSLKLSVVSHNFFWMIKTISSPSESAVATASQCKAVRYFFTK